MENKQIQKGLLMPFLIVAFAFFILVFFNKKADIVIIENNEQIAKPSIRVQEADNHPDSVSRSVSK